MTKQVDQCKLCLQQKELLGSHVLPEFLYKPLYDNKHRFFRLSTDPGDRELTKFKGIREPLFCEDCERLLNQRYEDYASKVLTNQLKVARVETRDKLVLRGIDYSRFKLFELSILWRSHVSTGDEFSQVNLGPIHSERLRGMILNADPGEPHEYGCIVFFFAKVPRELHQLIYPPEPMVIRGFGVYRAVFGGLFWCYIISDRPHTFPLWRLFLSREGELVLHKNDKFFTEFVAGLGEEMTKARRLRGTA